MRKLCVFICKQFCKNLKLVILKYLVNIEQPHISIKFIRFNKPKVKTLKSDTIPHGSPSKQGGQLIKISVIHPYAIVVGSVLNIMTLRLHPLNERVLISVNDMIMFMMYNELYSMVYISCISVCR